MKIQKYIFNFPLIQVEQNRNLKYYLLHTEDTDNSFAENKAEEWMINSQWYESPGHTCISVVRILSKAISVPKESGR